MGNDNDTPKPVISITILNVLIFEGSSTNFVHTKAMIKEITKEIIPAIVRQKIELLNILFISMLFFFPSALDINLSLAVDIPRSRKP
jgi:hypothetical protein